MDSGSFDMTELQIQEKPESPAMNRDPITGAPGAHPVGTGIGAAGGAAAGAAVGSMVGPLGTAVGGVVGAVVGGLAGKGVGEAVNPTAEEVEILMPDINQQSGTRLDPSTEDIYWQRAFITEPYYSSELIYDDYGPAYRAGYLHRQHKPAKTWEEAETVLQSEWERGKGTSRLSWEDAREPMHAAWHRADHQLSGGDPYFGVQ
jgi:hypothetical protein